MKDINLGHFYSKLSNKKDQRPLNGQIELTYRCNLNCIHCYCKGIKDKGIDTLVLGCTHYPLLKKVITRLMGKDVRLIDSAVEVAQEIKTTLEITGLKGAKRGKPLREFYVTDSPEKFRRLGEKFLGQKIEHIEKVEVGN